MMNQILGLTFEFQNFVTFQPVNSLASVFQSRSGLIRFCSLGCSLHFESDLYSETFKAIYRSSSDQLLVPAHSTQYSLFHSASVKSSQLRSVVKFEAQAPSALASTRVFVDNFRLSTYREWCSSRILWFSSCW